MADPPTAVAAAAAAAAAGDPPTTLVDLPINVALQILSYLPTPEAIQTNLISPKWQNLWHSLTSLSFDFTQFPADTPLVSFFYYISRALIIRSHSLSPLRCLRLKLPSTPDLRQFNHDINSYIHYAVARKAKILDISVHTDRIRLADEPREEFYHDFPFYLLKNGSVTCLCLDRVTISTITSGNTLTHVSLTHICLTDHLISELVEKCVNLQHFALRACYGMRDIKINSKKLGRLCLGNYVCNEGSVEVTAPNLCELDIAFFDVGRFVMEGALDLVEATIWCNPMPESLRCWIQVFRWLGSAKRLLFPNWGYRMVKAVAEKDIIFKKFSLNNLKYLELLTEFTKSDMLGIATLVGLSPNLETLIFQCSLKREEDTPEILEAFSKINLSLPSLRQLQFRCYWGTEEDFRFLQLIIRDQVVLERIVIHTFPMCIEGKRVPPIILVKQEPQGFQIIQGSFPLLAYL